ncbi:hypothetical protein [Egbenema bharatensis]|uniref:hypothetical protein n=1 Tax=Egbenema bharatensis TaxID=3463334 RepID=UPI003A86622B
MQSSITLTPETARNIACEAYTYGFPMVESYKTLYKQAIATSHPNFKACCCIASSYHFHRTVDQA